MGYKELTRDSKSGISCVSKASSAMFPSSVVSVLPDSSSSSQ